MHPSTLEYLQFEILTSSFFTAIGMSLKFTPMPKQKLNDCNMGSKTTLNINLHKITIVKFVSVKQ